MEIMPISEAKAHLSGVVDRVEKTHERILLTKNGRAAAMLIAKDDFEGMEETMALLSDPQAMKELRESQKDVEEGRVHKWEDIKDAWLKGELQDT